MNNGSNDLGLAVVGCDFRVASSHWRSLMVLDDSQATKLAADLKRNQAADGFVDLNTCNRNEWIVSGPDPRWAAELLKSRMLQRVGEKAQQHIEPYVYLGEAAARHIFRVAIGQESLVTGERQIAGQLYRALEVSRQRGTSSRIINGLGSIAGRLVRIALRRGCIESAAVGVHSLALAYLNKNLEDKPTRVAVIGLGRIGRRVLGVLEDARQLEPIALNRTLTPDNQDRVRPLTALEEVLDQVDAAIICTGARDKIITSSQLKPRSATRPLLLIDIGIPEQVERVGLPANVSLAGLDQLVEFHQANQVNQASNKNQARELVDRAVFEFKAFCNEQAYSGILDAIQKNHRQLVGEEIPHLIARRLDYLPDEARDRLESDLKNIVLEYTSEVFRSIKETAVREAQEASGPVRESQCQDESSK
ncbi:MAG: hypothetical protein JRJ87_02230 [Deltaproteobacteria bacterium]|nr:hypothetical protein [Deltaproteobacteria bacterium]